MATNMAPQERYQKKLQPGPGECVSWRAKIDRYGNAQFTYTDESGRHRDIGAHRWGWESANGPISADQKMRNECGLKSCQNMAHWTLIDANRNLTVEQRYRARFTVLGPDDCWPWQERARDKNGYGIITYRENNKNITVRAHRLGWNLRHDESLTDDEMVCHTCDNPPCQNPAHWFKGTAQANVDDMISKGRQVVLVGVNRRNAIVNEDIVGELRRRFDAGGISQQKLADEFGYSRSLVRKVVTRKTWGWVPE